MVRRADPLLAQTSFDSASPLGAALVAHRFAREGAYDIDLGERRGGGSLAVRTAATAARAGFDLGRLAGHADVAAGGWASFRSSDRRTAGLPVVVRRRDAGEAEFDSRRLGEADLFAVRLLRPGLYAVHNEPARAEGRIAVRYPVVGKRPFRPPGPLTVTCAAGRFDPAELRIDPGQGVVFRFKTPSRITIDLIEPDDGPRRG